MEKADLMRLAATLSPAERAFFSTPTTAASADPWKWQAHADAIAEGDAVKVVKACRAAIKQAADNPDQHDADPGSVAELAPALASAAVASARRRGKSIAWSLGRVADYLQSEAAAAARAATARKATFADPPREVPAVKGGAK